jgi:transposase
MLEAIRYLVAGGISWRAMLADFPDWARVYAFFRRWRENGLVAESHDRLRGRVRDREAAVGLLTRLRALHRDICLVWADGGYTGSLIDWARQKNSPWPWRS